MDREEFEDWLREEFGLQLYATFGGSNERVYINPDVLGVGAIINYSTKEFRFEFTLPHSTFFLDSGKMSPCTKKDFFSARYIKFLDTSIKIKSVC